MDNLYETLTALEFQISGLQIFFAVVILVAGITLNRTLHRLSASLFGRDVRWASWLRLWIPVVRVAVWLITITAAVAILAPPPQLVFALLASLSVAVGLAAQELIKNIFGAIVIWSDRVYAEGDRVTIGNVQGIVQSIGLRSTKVWAYDDTMIAVPNSHILSEAIYNANSGAPSEQVVIDLYLPLHADVTLAMKLAQTAAVSCEYLDTAKPVVVRVSDEFQDRPLSRIRVKAYVRGVVYETAFASEVSERAKRLFRERGLYNGAGTS